MLKVIAGQFGLGVVLAAVFWSVFGTVAGYSALLGMLVAAVPNMFLALRLSVPRRDGGPKALVRAAYIGEIGKLALTVLIFSIVFVTVRPLDAGPFFTTFIVTVMVPLAGLLFRIDAYEEQETVDKHGE